MQKYTTYTLSPDEVLKAVLSHYRIPYSPYEEPPEIEFDEGEISFTVEEEIEATKPKKRGS